MKKIKLVLRNINSLLITFLSKVNIEISSKYLYRIKTKKTLDLKDPQTFNEKLMWLKINVYQDNPIVWRCVDKYAIREFLQQKKISDKNLPKIIHVYNNVEEIDFKNLPLKFALKCTHGCGFNIICNDKKQLNIDETKKKLTKWKKRKFGYSTAELQYIHHPPKIICEEFIESNKTGFPWDYKVYCFWGLPKVILVCTNRENGYKTHFYTEKWEKIYLREDQSLDDIDKPKSLEEMIEISIKVSKDFPFVRIDFYEYNGHAILGEMTFTPAACLEKYSNEGDKYLSNLLDISKLVEKKNEK